MNNLYVDIHTLQSMPPSNINRDDTGAPKSAEVGGTRRGRISSQAKKHVMRDLMRASLPADKYGVRTKDVVDHLAAVIREQDETVEEAEALALAESAFTAAGIKIQDKKQSAAAKKANEGKPAGRQAGYLMFVSNQQYQTLATQLLEDRAAGEPLDKKLYKSLLKENNSIDLGLMGRMVADDVDLRVDSAVQVAHLLSVNAVEIEADYYTAVDDQREEAAESGAGMIGTIEFNSATYYGYANVNANQLLKNLGDAEVTVEALRQFVSTFIASVPTGKSNTFANQTLPEAVMIVVRSDRPVSYAGAYEDAIVSERGYVQEATKRLADAHKDLTEMYGTSNIAGIWTSGLKSKTEALDEVSTRVPVTQAIDEAVKLVAEHLESQS